MKQQHVHTPVDLETAFNFQRNFEEYGDMRGKQD